MRHFDGEKLVVATHNKGKLREFSELLAPFAKLILSAGDLNLPEPDETGTTFEENAILKAVAAAKPDAKLTILPGMNHVLKIAPTDRAANVATYTDPNLPLAPGLADAVTAFIEEHSPKEHSP